MQTQMIKIERNAKMEKAAARCRNVHPKVRRVDAQTVTVYGSKGDAYTVRFAEPKPGLKLACCNCKAGQASQLCFHIPAALVAPVIKTGAAAQPERKPVTRSTIEHGFYTCPRTRRSIPALRVDGWDV